MVEDFTYLGSVLSSNGDVMEEVKNKTAKASKVFGCLRDAVFSNPSLSIKREVYEATVLAVLLYGARDKDFEGQTFETPDFILQSLCEGRPGVRYEQWKERLTSRTLSGRFGIEWSIVGM